MLFRRTRIRRRVEEFYWEGFFSRLGSGFGPEPPLEFSIEWLNRVRKVAYPAGWLRADKAIKVDSQKRFGSELKREIPPSVYAEAMGA